MKPCLLSSPPVHERLSSGGYHMKIMLLSLLCFLLTSCAAKKFAIDNADTLISHQINKRLPLYSKQKEELSKDIDKFLNDSKPLAQEIIPVVDEIDLKDEAKLEGQYQKLESYFMDISKKFSAMMSGHLAKLDKKQQKDFFETLDDENRQLLKREKGDRIDSIEERFEMFFGSITSQQKQLIVEYSDYFHERARQKLDRRVKLHQEFRQIFSQEDLSETGREKMLQDAFVEYQNESLKGNKNLEMLKKLLPTLSKGQREHFRRQTTEVKELLKYFLSVDY